jgi:hypothetical protein
METLIKNKNSGITVKKFLRISTHKQLLALFASTFWTDREFELCNLNNNIESASQLLNTITPDYFIVINRLKK